ncbi:alpha-amylase family glycosyl hydrolase [Gracilibacillus xinjiangensis]|uniref:Alpha-amylase family glycosyl hydrolase n=1 Tax=Gracilibacillus xinjiangensis TaxID=1193282 RepID=A0ABV8WTM0_9BACI
MNKIRFGWLSIIACIIFIIPISQVDAADHLDERIYYILVDRFVNGNNDNDLPINIEDPEAYHGGDIAGVIDTLAEIKEKGFTAINLSPIMASESYHGFDTLDHQAINQHFGTVEELRELVEQAHEHDLKIILDFVISQVSPAHPFASQEQAEGLFNQQVSNLELTSDSNDYIIEAAQFWINEAGVDGFHLYVNETTNSQVVEQFQDTISDNAFVIAEGIENVGITMNQAFQQDAVNMLKQPSQSLAPLFEEGSTIAANKVNYMDSVLTNRFTFETASEGYHPVTRWKLATTLLYTLPGSSLLYQGVEVPMDNGEAEPDHRMAELNKEDEEITKHIEKLSRIREVSPALTSGEFELVDQVGAMTVFKRETADETMYVAINNDTKTQVAMLEGINSDMQLTGLLEDDIVREQEDGTHRIVLDRETSNIFIVEENTGFNWFFITMMIAIFGGFIAFVIAFNSRVKKHQTK